MKALFAIILLCVIGAVVWFSQSDSPKESKIPSGVNTKKIKKVTKVINSKVLFIDSYHQGYVWSDGIIQGAIKVLDESKTNNVSLKIVYMDTKRNNTEKFKKEAALKAKAVIDSWKPDIVITSDDNAAKYLIAPYYNLSNLPFVFTGINWSAVEYGFPYPNVTGMLEVILFDQIISTMSKYAKGKRIAFIKGDDLSARKEAEFCERIFGIEINKHFVKNFAQWEKEYISLQDEADMIFVGNAASIKNWDAKKAKDIILTNTKVPTATWDSWMAPYCLITFANNPQEQGQWAAKTALDILNGKSPSSISMVKNKKANIIINMPLAKKLNIVFPVDFLNSAKLIE